MTLKTIVVAVPIFLVVIFGVVLLLPTKKSPEEEELNENMKNNPSSELLIVQQLVGDEVVIKRAHLANSGFVVIREVVDGILGQILEVSQYLTPGDYTDLKITLSSSADDTSDIIAVLYKDDGDTGFSSALDTRVTEEGNVVAKSFSTGDSVPDSVFSVDSLEGISEDKVTYVLYTDQGYVPESIEVKRGDTVVFKNQSSKKMWVASDPHPAHSILSTFDQFKFGLPGEEYQYTFTKTGSWKYHDHINASNTGVITVIENENN